MLLGEVGLPSNMKMQVKRAAAAREDLWKVPTPENACFSRTLCVSSVCCLQLQYTPLETDRHMLYYNVKLLGISVGDQDLGLSTVRPVL